MNHRVSGIALHISGNQGLIVEEGFLKAHKTINAQKNDRCFFSCKDKTLKDPLRMYVRACALQALNFHTALVYAEIWTCTGFQPISDHKSHQTLQIILYCLEFVWLCDLIKGQFTLMSGRTQNYTQHQHKNNWQLKWIKLDMLLHTVSLYLEILDISIHMDAISQKPPI